MYIAVQLKISQFKNPYQYTAIFIVFNYTFMQTSTFHSDLQYMLSYFDSYTHIVNRYKLGQSLPQKHGVEDEGRAQVGSESILTDPGNICGERLFL